MTECARTVLVTGAARRIGAGIIRHFHTNGFNVIIHFRTSSAEAQQLCGSLNAQRPTSAALLQADLNDAEAVALLGQQAMTCFGRLDVLVNNASSFYATPLPHVTPAQWEDLFNSNLRAAFFLSQQLSPELRLRSGCIVNMSDIHGEQGLKNYPVYSMAKAGMMMLTRSLAKELAPHVRVNAVSPGAILWPEQDADAPGKQRILESIPLGHVGSVQDVAEAVWFLAHAGYITGQILRVDGGRALRLP